MAGGRQRCALHYDCHGNVSAVLEAADGELDRMVSAKYSANGFL